MLNLSVGLDTIASCSASASLNAYFNSIYASKKGNCINFKSPRCRQRTMASQHTTQRIRAVGWMVEMKDDKIFIKDETHLGIHLHSYISIFLSFIKCRFQINILCAFGSIYLNYFVTKPIDNSAN
uniref:Battenin n=1 Tax=Parascaris univalens TaxID=6257 RepID=A0A915C4K1_PARUN